MNQDFRDLPERLARVQEEIARRQALAGWSHPLTIVAVTKGFGPDAVRAAQAAGLADIGENRVQEALAKIEALAEAPLTWHLIGHLQRNKAKFIPGRFAVVHSVDSASLATELERRAGEEAGRSGDASTIRVLVQVNVAGEEQKSGCTPAQAPEIARAVTAQPHLKLEGLMTIAPFTDDWSVQRNTFRALRLLRDELQKEGLWVPALSMGMSADYGMAVEEGATILRLGTALFGPRMT
ncbi:MAG TPA: YggS family pyridoxal phosphate-dependent enzyme [Gemmatimonadales bacterium]|nr:YggS family pyridoxal phosphate-dependent enzyme [Gemmatimonadales bacterium]